MERVKNFFSPQSKQGLGRIWEAERTARMAPISQRPMTRQHTPGDSIQQTFASRKKNKQTFYTNPTFCHANPCGK
jgi:hypothetical protein